MMRLASGSKSLTRAESVLTEWLGHVDHVRATQVVMVTVAAESILLANAIAQSRTMDTYWGAFAAWLFGVFMLGVALVYLPVRPHIRIRAELITAVRVEALAVVGLTLLGFALRVIDLTSIPYPLAGDEASVGMEGELILAGHSTNMFVSGWSAEPMMSFLPYALTQAIFGSTIFSIRIISVIIGTLNLPFIYLLARSMFNGHLAILSAILLAVLNLHIHFSRIAVNNIGNALAVTVVVWLAFRAVETQQSFWFAAAGIAGGLSMYSYAGTRFSAIIAGIYLLVAFLRDRRLWSGLVNFGLTAGLVLFPIAVYFLQRPDIAMARLNQMGVFQNGWLAAVASRTHQEPLWLIFGNIASAFLIFVSTPALEGFWNSLSPLLDGAWSLFFMLGIFFSLLNLREPPHALLQFWFWSVIIVAGGLTVPPPGAERLVMALPVVVLFVAYGIWKVASLLAEALSLAPSVVPRAMALIALVLALTSLNFYFRVYTPRYMFSDANSEVGMELGQYLATIPRDAQVYFLGEPRVFIGFPSIVFLSHHLDGVDILTGDHIKDKVETGRQAIFVALPNHYQEMDEIRAIYPGGRSFEVFRRTKPSEPLYIAYEVDSPAP